MRKVSGIREISGLLQSFSPQSPRRCIYTEKFCRSICWVGNRANLKKGG